MIDSCAKAWPDSATPDKANPAASWRRQAHGGPGPEVPKPFGDKNLQVCGIISDGWSDMKQKILAASGHPFSEPFLESN